MKQQVLKDRLRTENLAVRQIKRITRLLTTDLIQATVYNRNLIQTLHSRNTELITTLTDAMILSHLQAKETFTNKFKIKAPTAYQFTLLTNAQNAVKKQSTIDRQTLVDLYKPLAEQEIMRKQKRVEIELQKTVKQLLENNLHGQSAIQYVREALNNQGITFSQPWAYETLTRTQTNLAYSVAQLQSVQDPDVKDEIWGYEYSAVGDSRTRPEHQEYDGFKAAKEDPIWENIMPPRSYNCRCTVIPIFNDEAPTTASTPPNTTIETNFNPMQLL